MTSNGIFRIAAGTVLIFETANPHPCELSLSLCRVTVSFLDLTFNSSYDFGIAALINNFTGWGKAPTSLARSCPCKSIQSECRKKCLHFFLIEDNSTREQMF